MAHPWTFEVSIVTAPAGAGVTNRTMAARRPAPNDLVRTIRDTRTHIVCPRVTGDDGCRQKRVASTDRGHHFPGFHTRMVLEHLSACSGDAGVAELLRRSGETRTEDVLRDDTLWSSYHACQPRQGAGARDTGRGHRAARRSSIGSRKRAATAAGVHVRQAAHSRGGHDLPHRTSGASRTVRWAPGPTTTSLVIGSGFGGSTAALRLTEKGYRVGVLEAGRRFDESTLPKTSWRLRSVPLGADARLLRHPADLAAQGRHGPARAPAWAAARSTTPTRSTSRWPPFYADRAVGPHHRLAGRAGALLRPGQAHARRRRRTRTITPSDEVMREVAEEMGVGDTFHPTPVGRVLRRARRRGGRPVLRRRRAAAARAASSAASA